MIVSRRALIGGAAALAFAGSARGADFGAARYGKAMIIDGLSSLGALDPKAPGIADQLAVYRASGLTAIHQTVGAAGNTPGRYGRSEESRVGKECGRTFRSRWSPCH